MASTSVQLRLTKAAIDAIPLQDASSGSTQRVYLDSELRGFGLRVGARAKTFFVQRDVQAKTVRVTLGPYGVMTVAQARERAREVLMQMVRGVNPNDDRRAQQERSITLRAALNMHLGRNKTHATRTREGYEYLVTQYLSDWLNRPLSGLTRKECRDRHQDVGTAHGPYVANSAFRVLRAAYNTAMKVNEELGTNPTIAVDWFPESRRKSALLRERLPAWHAAIHGLNNPVRRDYLLFVLFTGLRRNDAATARWADVDWDNAALTVPAPKGGKPFQLPLTRQLLDLLRRRQACELTAAAYAGSEWIFPSKSATGHIAEPREDLKVAFTIHSLRNTFITVAESLDVSPYAIKMLVNHSTPDRQDVTAGYITPELQRLREPMQRVSDQLDKLLAGTAERGSHLRVHDGVGNPRSASKGQCAA